MTRRPRPDQKKQIPGGRGGAGAGMPVVPESHRVTRLGEALAAQTGAQDATSPRSVEVPPPAPQPPPAPPPTRRAAGGPVRR